MLSSVLRSPRAVEANIAIMRTFVQNGVSALPLEPQSGQSPKKKKPGSEEEEEYRAFDLDVINSFLLCPQRIRRRVFHV